MRLFQILLFVSFSFFLVTPLSAVQPSQQGEDKTQFKQLIIEQGMTFSGVMQQIGVPTTESLAITKATFPLFNLNKLKLGQVLYYKKSGKASPILDELRIVLPTQEIRYLANENRAIKTGWHLEKLTQFNKKSVTEWQTENPSQYKALTQLFGYQIDFDKPLKKRDQFVVLYDQYKDEYGSLIKTENLRYAAFSYNGKIYNAYLFNNNYYDGNAKPLNVSPFAKPLEQNLVVTSGFGWRRHPVKGFRDFHPAVDYRAPLNTNVLATADGVVDFIGYDQWLGNTVIIKHSNGWSSQYGHFNSFQNGLKKGSKVKTGDIIGYAGATGIATAPHLHFSLIQGKDKIDPRPFLVTTPPLSLQEEADFFLVKKAIDAEIKMLKPQ